MSFADGYYTSVTVSTDIMNIPDFLCLQWGRDTIQGWIGNGSGGAVCTDGVITPFRNVNSSNYCSMPKNDYVSGNLNPESASILTAKKDMKYSISGADFISISQGQSFSIRPNSLLVCMEP